MTKYYEWFSVVWICHSNWYSPVLCLVRYPFEQSSYLNHCILHYALVSFSFLKCRINNADWLYKKKKDFFLWVFFQGWFCLSVEGQVQFTIHNKNIARKKFLCRMFSAKAGKLDKINFLKNISGKVLNIQLCELMTLPHLTFTLYMKFWHLILECVGICVAYYHKS